MYVPYFSYLTHDGCGWLVTLWTLFCHGCYARGGDVGVRVCVCACVRVRMFRVQLLPRPTVGTGLSLELHTRANVVNDEARAEER